MNNTPFMKKEDAMKDSKWLLLDATGKTLGRFASEIAKILRGKHKPSYTPNVDMGDSVIVINADKIKVTGKKEAQKVYRHYTGYIGGLREIPYRTMLQKNPERIIFHAVSGMMPRSRLTEKQLKKLRVYRDDKHDLQAQKPIVVSC